MLETPARLLLGLLTGIAFGFLLQKGRVAKFPVIVGQFLLRDWTVVKIMLTAVAVGSLGVYALVFMEQADLHIKPAHLGNIAIGGILFGIGIAVFGYCPGTSIAACGEGHRDAMAGVAGMLFGAFMYVWLYPGARTLLAGFPDWGKVTIPQVTGTSPWVWIAGLIVCVFASGFVLRSIRHRWMAKHA